MTGARSAEIGFKQTEENEDEHEHTTSFEKQGLQEDPQSDNSTIQTVEPTEIEANRTEQSKRPIHSVFTSRQKWFIVFMASFGGFFSPLSANIYFPALNTLSRELKVSDELINLTLTSYMIFQGLAPTMFGDLADMAGRRPAYMIAFIIYIAANIGLACQNSYAALFVLRCLQSSGSSGTIALSNAVVADVSTPSERGTYMGWAVAGAMMGSTIGPIIGGVLSQFLGWRAIFWFLVILAVSYFVVLLITFPETGRNVVGDGSIPPQGWNMSLMNHLKMRKLAKAHHGDELQRTTTQQAIEQRKRELAQTRKLRFPNPLNTIRIIAEKDVALILFYNSLVYTAFYDVITTIPSQFELIYGFNDLQVGLSFIPFGFGALLATFLNGRLMDFNYRRIAKKAGISVDKKRGEDLRYFPIEKARLQIILPMLYAGIAMILGYGWALDREAHLAVPLVITFFLGLLLTSAFNAMSTMLIDLYPQSPATATAANNLVRCLVGAAGTAVIIQMINAMGRGWCFTFVAAVVFCFSPMLWIELKMGSKWREERRVRLEQKAKEKEAKRLENVEKAKAG